MNFNRKGIDNFDLSAEANGAGREAYKLKIPKMIKQKVQKADPERRLDKYLH